jgi:hypothetical protein
MTRNRSSQLLAKVPTLITQSVRSVLDFLGSSVTFSKKTAPLSTTLAQKGPAATTRQKQQTHGRGARVYAFGFHSIFWRWGCFLHQHFGDVVADINLVMYQFIVHESNVVSDHPQRAVIAVMGNFFSGDACMHMHKQPSRCECRSI